MPIRPENKAHYRRSVLSATSSKSFASNVATRGVGLQFLSGLWYYFGVSAGWERPQDPNGKGHHYRSMRLPSMGDFGATDERPVKRGAA